MSYASKAPKKPLAIGFKSFNPFIGVEKSAEYARIARENVKRALAHPPFKGLIDAN
ncbi:hypothetical protein [Helicobacter labacensis]|uniref:hypothetical protein n=1 Tax=Helicobacter labacensis TaxID=2316079 RepID=UPI0013CE00FE|nr:hypothetical protein [Helicobacter labacensis]